MTRIGVTFAFVTGRLIEPAFEARHSGCRWNSSRSREDVLGDSAIPLLVTELVIQGRKTVLAVRAD